MKKTKINNQKIAPVLVAYTTPEMWRAAQKTNIAVQGNNRRDAENVAFLRTGLKDENGKTIPGVLTHIAEVKKIENDVPVERYLNMSPELKEYYKDRGWEGFCKFYYLGEIKELSKSIPHRKGDGSRGQVLFFTTLDEIQNASVLSDIKTLRQLENNK